MHAIDSVITCVGKLGMSELYAASTRRDGRNDSFIRILAMNGRRHTITAVASSTLRGNSNGGFEKATVVCRFLKIAT